jgi:hypothetical protein
MIWPRTVLWCAAVALLGLVGFSRPAEPPGFHAQIQALRFTSDHRLLRRADDLLSTGEPYGDVQWRAGARSSVPISHTVGNRIAAVLTMTVLSGEGNAHFELEGVSNEPGLCFRTEGELPTEGTIDIRLTATKSLGPAVRKIEAPVLWRLMVKADTRAPQQVSLGRTGPHVVYVTLGKPRNADQPAGLVTDRRLALAVERVAAAQQAAGLDASGPRLVYELMQQNGKHYLPTRHYRGAGAWNLPASWDKNPPGASCLAIVEFVKLVCDMIGLEGEARLAAYCARPEEPDRALRGGLGDPPQFKRVGDATQQLFLIDQRNTRQGQVGGVGGANYYEAVLEFDWRGKRYYYPGGTDRVFGDPAKILQVFHTLAWTEYDPQLHDWVVREVLRTYVPPDGKFPPSVPLP